ncbi:unnamed protein product, partial [Symbiodinium pilosum]
YTPPKLWPAELAQSYFGNRTSFGILRDPLERLVSQFRGSFRFQHAELGCDVNRGVKMMMQNYLAALAAGNPFVENCNYLPQAEFFDAPFGAQQAIDNRLFPLSMNKFFAAHDSPDLHIATDEISHVAGCDEVWAAELDEEAKSLVRQVYQRDYDLICREFGHCNFGEATCLRGVPGMCPEHLFQWHEEAKMYMPRGS